MNEGISKHTDKSVGKYNHMLRKLARVTFNKSPEMTDRIAQRDRILAIQEKERMGFNFTRDMRVFLRNRLNDATILKEMFLRDIMRMDEQITEDDNKTEEVLQDIVLTKLDNLFKDAKSEQMTGLFVILGFYQRVLVHKIKQFKPFSNFLQQCCDLMGYDKTEELLHRYKALMDIFSELYQEYEGQQTELKGLEVKLFNMKTQISHRNLLLHTQMCELQKQLHDLQAEVKEWERYLHISITLATADNKFIYNIKNSIFHIYQILMTRRKLECTATDPFTQLEEIARLFINMSDAIRTFPTEHPEEAKESSVTLQHRSKSTRFASALGVGSHDWSKQLQHERESTQVATSLGRQSNAWRNRRSTVAAKYASVSKLTAEKEVTSKSHISLPSMWSAAPSKESKLEIVGRALKDTIEKPKSKSLTPKHGRLGASLAAVLPSKTSLGGGKRLGRARVDNPIPANCSRDEITAKARRSMTKAVSEQLMENQFSGWRQVTERRLNESVCIDIHDKTDTQICVFPSLKFPKHVNKNPQRMDGVNVDTQPDSGPGDTLARPLQKRHRMHISDNVPFEKSAPLHLPLVKSCPNDTKETAQKSDIHAMGTLSCDPKVDQRKTAGRSAPPNMWENSGKQPADTGLLRQQTKENKSIKLPRLQKTSGKSGNHPARTNTACETDLTGSQCRGTDKENNKTNKQSMFKTSNAARNRAVRKYLRENYLRLLGNVKLRQTPRKSDD